MLDSKILPALQRARPGKVTLYDLASVVCPGGHPSKKVSGVGLIRPDGVHFSVDGSLWFAENYGDKVLRAGGL